MTTYHIYKITNNVDDFTYVGSTINMKNRWSDHRKWCKETYPKKQPVHLHMRKVGVDNCEMICIATHFDVTKLEACKFEQMEIDKIPIHFQLNGVAAYRSKDYWLEYHRIKQNKRYNENKHNEKYMEIRRKQWKKQYYKDVEKSRKHSVKKTATYRQKIHSDPTAKSAYLETKRMKERERKARLKADPIKWEAHLERNRVSLRKRRAKKKLEKELLNKN